MKWYDLLITDEFVDYFSNENNIFYTMDSGKLKEYLLELKTKSKQES